LEAFGKLDLKEGDTVFFYGGDFFNGTIRGIGINGTFKKPVVFTTTEKRKQKFMPAIKKGLFLQDVKIFRSAILFYMGPAVKLVIQQMG